MDCEELIKVMKIDVPVWKLELFKMWKEKFEDYGDLIEEKNELERKRDPNNLVQGGKEWHLLESNIQVTLKELDKVERDLRTMDTLIKITC